MNKKPRLNKIRLLDYKLKRLLLSHSGKHLQQIIQNMIDIGLDKPPLNILYSQLVGLKISTPTIKLSEKKGDSYPHKILRIKLAEEIFRTLKKTEYPTENIGTGNFDFYSKKLDRFLFVKTDFNKSDFGKASIINCLFHECSFDNADMEETEITNSFFYNCVFRKSYFRLTNINNTKIHNSHFYSTRFYGVNFIDSEIRTTRFSDSIFENCTSKGNTLINVKNMPL